MSSSISLSLQSGFTEDTIRITYHSKYNKPSTIKSFEEYGHDNNIQPPPYHPKPWLLFHSESEFDFAEIVHNTGMSNGQVDALIKVVHRMLQNHNEYFLIKNHSDLKHLWANAS